MGVDVLIPKDKLREARLAIFKAKRTQRWLTDHGIGIHIGNWQWVREGVEFEKSRTEFNPKQVATAIAYLRQRGESRGRGRRDWEGSYGLKHEAERWGERNGMEGYVSNGAMIVAAEFLRFRMKVKRGFINTAIAVKQERSDGYQTTRA